MKADFWWSAIDSQRNPTENPTTARIPTGPADQGQHGALREFIEDLFIYLFKCVAAGMHLSVRGTDALRVYLVHAGVLCVWWRVRVRAGVRVRGCVCCEDLGQLGQDEPASDDVGAFARLHCSIPGKCILEIHHRNSAVWCGRAIKVKSVWFKPSWGYGVGGRGLGLSPRAAAVLSGGTVMAMLTGRSDTNAQVACNVRTGYAPYPEYSRANSYPWSPFPRGGPVPDPVLACIGTSASGSRTQDITTRNDQNHWEERHERPGRLHRAERD